MALPRPLLQYIYGLVLFAACASALKFELQAQSGHGYYDKQQRCIRNFVSKDTLVVVTAIVSGTKGDGMIVNMNASPRPHASPYPDLGHQPKAQPSGPPQR